MKTALAARIKKLDEYNLTNQPLPVIIKEIVGKDKDKKDIVKYTCLVKYDECEYTVESPLKAVDLAFKAYHALQAYYPTESDPVWLFLQKAIYKFSDPKWDHYNDTTERLARDFGKFKM